MSPVSRGRKNKKDKKTPKRSESLDLFNAPAELTKPPAPDECDCPVCSGDGDDLDPQQLIDQLAGDAGELLAIEDPLEAELAGSAFASMGAILGEGFQEAVVGGFIPAFEAQGSAESSALLLAIGSVSGGEVGEAALSAVDRLAEAGVPRPGWAAELSEPVTVADCLRLSDPAGTGSMLACSFHRAGRSHAVMVSVDHLDCGAASEIVLLDADGLPEALNMIRAGMGDGLEITEEALDPAEFRWQLENALDARAVHDRDDFDPDADELPDEEDDGPGYRTLAGLLRARMRTLPAPSKPPAPHQDSGDSMLGLTMLQQLAGNPEAVFGARGPLALGGQLAPVKLPAKRKKSAGPAPIYQLKVGLRGAKPPIWRRLEVPADISLAQLHQVIQIAFDWDNSHLHAFQTPYGEFGTADAELGHRAEAPVTLEQVAPEARSTIRYTYDFGDDWEHDILVEKVLDRDETVSYPRCTGGRRAAPPEDSGGIWGYLELLGVLSDSAHPEHEDRLEWLGLDKADDFDPASFDAEAITKALSGVL
jgi:hypothetical protein